MKKRSDILTKKLVRWCERHVGGRSLKPAKKIMRSKDFDVNRLFGWFQETILSFAIRTGKKELRELLLARPDIDVNKRDKEGRTPFYDVCRAGDLESVTRLLKDKRVDIEIPKTNNQTPFWIACYNSRLEIIMTLLLNTNVKLVPFRGMDRSNKKESRMGKLLEQFERDHDMAQRNLRKKKGVLCDQYNIAQLLLLTILVSSGYFIVRTGKRHRQLRRFFGVATKLPLELQTILCNRVYNSENFFILSGSIELELRVLLKERFLS